MASYPIRAEWFGWNAPPPTPQFPVPDVVDITEAAALILINANHSAGTRTEATDATIVAGNVISTNPAAGVQHDQGAPIDYVVSTGTP